MPWPGAAHHSRLRATDSRTCGESSASRAWADANGASSERFLSSTCCGSPNCRSMERRAEAVSPGVSVSCSQLASPGSCVMRRYGVRTTSEGLTGRVTFMTSA